jgi:uncharacterized membrane protein YccC
VNTAIHVIRGVIAAAIAGLPVLLTIYPHWVWIPALVGALGVFANYVVPSVTQMAPLTTGYAPTIPQPIQKDEYPYTSGDSGHGAA